MPINQFDKMNLKSLRQDISAALASVSKKHGISLGIGNITFGEDRFTTRLTGQTLKSGQVNKVKEVNKVNTPNSHLNIGIFGNFTIGDTFKHRTKTFTVTGYNPRKPKNCIELVDQNGKKFSTSIEMISQKFK